MLIVSCRLLPYSLPFRQAWRTTRGTIAQRNGWLVELTTDTGLLGHGDCAPLPAAGTEAAPEAIRWLTSQLPLLPRKAPVAVLESLPATRQNPAACHALETALLDLISQAEHLSLRQWLSPTAGNELAVNGSGGVLDEQAFERTSELVQQGYQIIKLKVGLARVEQEIRLLQQLAAQLPADTYLRLDANGAWSRLEAREFVSGLTGLPVESLEEPLQEPRADWLLELQSMSGVALALDESLSRFSLEALLEQPPVRRLIIKPCVLGGLLAAKKLADAAQQAGMQTVVTSTLESAVGIRAAAQLAMAVDQPSRPLAHGLATSNWFATDVAQPPIIMNGRLQLPDIAGLGVHLKNKQD